VGGQWPEFARARVLLHHVVSGALFNEHDPLPLVMQQRRPLRGRSGVSWQVTAQMRLLSFADESDKVSLASVEVKLRETPLEQFMT
jgi:hypothetical protein